MSGAPGGPDAAGYGDALSRPFWAAAEQGRLVVQLCGTCGHHQFYPRPFCMECQADVDWVESTGAGTVHSLTTTHLKVSEDLEPPYYVALVELDEGPILLSRLVDENGEPLAAGVAIGDRVRVGWHARPDAPPLPVFVPV